MTRNRLTAIGSTLLLGLWSAAVTAQEIPKKVDVDININTPGGSGGGGWYTNWWVWGIVLLVFIVVIVAITNRGRAARE